MLYVEELADLFIKNKTYFIDTSGIKIVPILLLANLFLGIYYNLSIWYKLTNKTKLGAMVAIGGALATIVLNIIFIPQYGFTACAWITLGVYAAMCLAAFILGQKYFKVPYNIFKILLLIISSFVFWQLFLQVNMLVSLAWISIFLKLGLLGIMMLIIWLLQPKAKKA